MGNVLPPHPTPWPALDVGDSGLISFSSYKDPGGVSQGLWGLPGPHTPDLPLPLVPCPMSIKVRLLCRGIYLVGFKMHEAFVTHMTTRMNATAEKLNCVPF